jgi:transcriptional regulator with PAS, ATPase and Fis domain
MVYRCAACGEIITTSGNTKYCSKKCRSDKPPKVLEIEQRYKKAFPEVVTEIMNQTNRIYSTADILDISARTLYTYLKKYNIKKGKYRWFKVG